MQPKNNSRQYSRNEKNKEYDEKVIEIKRISKKTKGGNQINFSALVVVGNHKGKAGIGHDKAKDVVSAIKKAIRAAKKNFINISMDKKGSIPYELYIKDGAAKVMLKPAPEGTGVIAGGPIRAVVEAFGIRNIVSKRLGSSNKASNVVATFKALKQIKSTSSKKDNTKSQKK